MAKMTRKEMKGPDEFLAATQEFWDWVIENRRPISLAAAGVLGLGLSVALASWGLENRHHERGALLSRALEAASKPVVNATNPSTTPPGEREFYDNEEEKMKVAREALQKAIDEDPSSEAGLTATLRLAKLLADAPRAAPGSGDAPAPATQDEAAQLYERWLQNAPRDSAQRLFALEGLGYAKEAQGDLAGARAAFARLSTEAAAPERAAYQAARLLEKEGKKDEAEKAYRALAKEFPEHEVATEALTRLDLLAALTAPPNPPSEPAPASAPKKAAPRKKGAK
jgi:hypothetical protein